MTNERPAMTISDEAVEAAAKCPIAYDHNDDLDECMVCGWTLESEVTPVKARGPKDMTNMTGPERIREAIDRLNGRYAPTRPILFRCREEGDA